MQFLFFFLDGSLDLILQFLENEVLCLVVVALIDLDLLLEVLFLNVFALFGEEFIDLFPSEVGLDHGLDLLHFIDGN